jgi:aspartate-semialdehyde dehydrogenase
MQALSGAGYPGVPALDVTDNILPFIKDEEQKLATEPLKVLGALSTDGCSIVQRPTMQISAHCNRVAVSDGHTVCMSMRMKSRNHPAMEGNAAVLDQVRGSILSFASNCLTGTACRYGIVCARTVFQIKFAR